MEHFINNIYGSLDDNAKVMIVADKIKDVIEYDTQSSVILPKVQKIVLKILNTWWLFQASMIAKKKMITIS